MGYIVDLTLILCRSFGSQGNASPSKVQSAISSFTSLKTSIHNDISSFIQAVPQFDHYDSDIVMAKIIDLISRNCSK